MPIKRPPKTILATIMPMSDSKGKSCTEKNWGIYMVFSSPSFLKSVYELQRWWYLSHNSIKAMPKPKKLNRTMMLCMHPIWYLLCESSLQVHFLRGHAAQTQCQLQMHQYTTIIRNIGKTNKQTIINCISKVIPNCNDCFLLVITSMSTLELKNHTKIHVKKSRKSTFSNAFPYHSQ